MTTPVKPNVALKFRDPQEKEAPRKPLVKIKQMPQQEVEFDSEGIPRATKGNVDRMSLTELENVCKKGWNLEKHINPLLVQLGEYVDVPAKATKHEKCQAIVKYKKDYPTGVSGRKPKGPERKDTYESFNWRKETDVRFRGQTWILPHSTAFKREIAT